MTCFSALSSLSFCCVLVLLVKMRFGFHFCSICCWEIAGKEQKTLFEDWIAFFLLDCKTLKASLDNGVSLIDYLDLIEYGSVLFGKIGV